METRIPARLNPVAASEDSPTARQLRDFGLMLGVLFVLALGVAPLLRSHHPRLWPFLIGGALWFVAIVFPARLRTLHAIWTALGHALGWFNTRLILAVLFLVWIVPMGLVMRLFGRDRLGRNFEPCRESYRTASRKRSRQSMEQPY